MVLARYLRFRTWIRQETLYNPSSVTFDLRQCAGTGAESAVHVRMGGHPPQQRMRRFYYRLRQCGKPGNVAVVAVMRKILFQLNAVARRGTPWVPQDACPHVLEIPQKGLTSNTDT